MAPPLGDLDPGLMRGEWPGPMVPVGVEAETEMETRGEARALLVEVGRE